MHTIEVAQFGGPEVLHFGYQDVQRPNANDVRIKVAYAGVNFLDIYHRRGWDRKPTPFVPGVEGSGIVIEKGEAVTGIAIGDRVLWLDARMGSYAEEAIIGADRIIPLPDDICFERGAALLLQGITTHYLLHEYRPIGLDTTVLIHAAAGGMGLLLVQWAKRLGARVLGTTSTESKAQLAYEAGADKVIVYTTENFVERVCELTGGVGADLVIDGIGKDTFNRSLQATASRGTTVVYGGAGGFAEALHPEVIRRALRVAGGSVFEYTRGPGELHARAAAVMEAVRSGWLLLRTTVLPLSQARQVHEKLEGRATTGKLLLRVGDLD